MATVTRNLRPFARFQFIAIAVAAVSLMILGAVIVQPPHRVAGNLNAGAAELSAIAARAERMQAFAQHLRKASLSSSPQPELAYAGFVKDLSRLRPGEVMKLARPDLINKAVVIVSARRVGETPALQDATQGKFELVLVTARLSELPNAPEISFFVTVAPIKVSSDTPVYEQSL